MRVTFLLKRSQLLRTNVGGFLVAADLCWREQRVDFVDDPTEQPSVHGFGDSIPRVCLEKARL